MRRIILATAVLVLAVSVQVPTKAAPRQELSWSCAPLTALRYTGKWTPLDTRFGNRETNSEHVLLRSHMTETGEYLPSSGGLTAGSFVLRVAACVSGKTISKSRSWNTSIDVSAYPAVQRLIPQTVDVEYTLTDAEAEEARYHFVATGTTDPDNQPAAGLFVRSLSIEGDAVFDLAHGWLSSVTGTWKGGANSTQQPSKFEFELAASKTFEDRAAMDKDVEKAIALGLTALDGMPDSWDYRGDYASLAAYTFLHGGRKADHESTRVALEKMKKRSKALPFVQMYHAGALAMAIESQYITDAERRLVAKGQSPSEFKRAISPDDRALMTELVDWIASKQEESTPGLLGYGQSPGQPVDLSNTQFAALALAAASRCGVDIPVGLIRDMGNGVTKFQQNDGPEVYRVKERKKNGKWVYERYPDKARGFSYAFTPSEPPVADTPTGSMTGAGVCVMLVLLDIYESFDADRRKEEMGSTEAKEWLRNVQASANSGAAWLQHNYALDYNPGTIDGRTNYYYYLYALERVGAFTPTEFIGEHSWYEDGALTLLVSQEEKGSWGAVEDTCFAILFLSRATTPTRRVITGK